MKRSRSKFFSPLFLSNFSAPSTSILKYLIPQTLDNHENCIFCIDKRKSANLQGGYLHYLSTNFNKLGYQIDRLKERNPMKQVANNNLNK